MLVPCHRHRSAAFSREFGCLKKYFCLLLTADDENPTSCFNDVNYSHFISTIHLPEQQSSISVWDAGCVMGSQWSSKHCPAYDSQSSCPKSPPSSAPGVAVGQKMAGGTTGRSYQEPLPAGKAPTAQQAAVFSQGQHQLTKLYFVTEFSPLTSPPFISHHQRCNSIIILCCSQNSFVKQTNKNG